MQVLNRLRSLRNLVGNTPLLAIQLTLDGAVRTIYAKAENLSMTGSIKDRMALHILGRAYADGTIQEGAVIAEATSGNTGISFAAIGRALGHRVVIFMPDWMSRERTDLLRSEPVKEGFLTPRIELLGFSALKRVCHTCCNPLDCVDASPLWRLPEDAPVLPPCPRR